MAENNGYQQSIYTGKFSSKGTAALDKDGNFCSESGKKQAILLLEGSKNPDPSKYEVVGSFKEGDIIDGHPSMVYNTVACPLPIPEPEFSADKTNVEYPVSRDGLGFDIKDSIEIVSNIDGVFKNYQVQSTPSWVTATKGNTSGVSNTLNLVISRNRTDDDERVGSIILVQDGSNQQITISVRQKGRLTEGTPTEYPYVNTEKILGEDEIIAQIGEQIIMARSMRGRTGLSTTQIDDTTLKTWHDANPSHILPTAEEYNSIAGFGYTMVPRDIVREMLHEENGDTEDNIDIYKHQLPDWDTDWLEMIGFLAAKAGATGTSTLPKSLGTSLMKYKLDETVDGYDDVRRCYPARWTADGSGMTPTVIKGGTDNYGLSFATLGNSHPYNTNAEEVRLFNFTEVHTRSGGTDPDWNILFASYGVESMTDTHQALAQGWNRKEVRTSFHAKTIRTFRYRKLPYDWYENGGKYKKIYNTETVPEGYTVVPKGIHRGILFGNPALADTERGVLDLWWAIYSVTSDPKNQIG